MEASGDSLHKNESEMEALVSTNLLVSSKSNNLSLVVLMGLPASGKSTLANKVSQLGSNWRKVIFSFDDYVPLNIQATIAQISLNEQTSAPPQLNYAKLLRKKFVHCIETVVKFAKESKSVVEFIDTNFQSYLSSLNGLLCSYDDSMNLVSNESLLSKVENVMKTLCDEYAKNSSCKIIILVDDNNYYHSMRNDFYQVAKQLEVGFCLIHCKSSLKTCVRRNSQRSVDMQVPHKVIVEMSLKFEDPNPLQNACDVYCVEIDLNDETDINLGLLEDIVSNSMRNPLQKNDDRTEEIERERRICSESEVHQADLVIRKLINKKLNLASFSNGFGKTNGKSGGSDAGNMKKKLSKELNERKKMMLEKLRSGDLKVAFHVEQDVEFQGEIVYLFENICL